MEDGDRPRTNGEVVAVMITISDTGPLVAYLNRNDACHQVIPWTAPLARR